MPAVVRLNDIDTGHGCFPPRNNVAGSGNVFTNGLATHRLGDGYENHSCISVHDSVLSQGSASVFVNGLPIGRIGDTIACGSATAEGSSNVFANSGDKKVPSVLSTPKLTGEITLKLVDTPEVYYTKNIQIVVTPEEITPDYTSPDYFPRNTEQIEKTDLDEVPIYVESNSPLCDELPPNNPYDMAINAYNASGVSLVDEWKENGSNPYITSLWTELGYDGNQFADETAWCAVFVSAILKRSRCKFIKTASSQAYSNYGNEISIEDIKLGDIVVFYRKGETSGFGHVGFYSGKKTSTTIDILGGNQGDTLSSRSFKILNLAQGWGIKSIRRPVYCKDPLLPLPIAINLSFAALEAGGSVT